MDHLLRFAAWVDRLSDAFGALARWAVAASCFISAGNAVVRHVAGISSNGMLEIQWYLLAVCVMLGAPKVLRLNEHVRVDLFYGRWSARGQATIDIAGILLFLFPTTLLLLWLSAPMAWGMFVSGEMSSNAGGLLRWPAMAMIPLGSAMLLLQGLAELVRRIGILRGEHVAVPVYVRPEQ